MSSKAKPAPRGTSFPVMVPKNRGLVRVYKIKVKGKKFYSVDWRLGSARKRSAYANFDTAMAEAKKIADSLITGDASGITIKESEKRIYLEAVKALRGTGCALDTAAREYAECRLLLKDRAGIVEAVRDYCRRNPLGSPNQTTNEAVAQFLDDRRKADPPLNPKYLSMTQVYLSKFTEAFSNIPIGHLTADLIKEWLGKIEGKTRSRQNHLITVLTLVNFCIDKKYLPTDWEGMKPLREQLGRYKQVTTNLRPLIFTPDDLQKLLSACPDDLLPFLAIKAFSGIRTDELIKLDWSWVKAEHIELPIEVVKKNTRRRIVPILPNLAAWLSTCRRPAGPIYVGDNVFKEFPKIASKAKVPWKKNALRHSYASYRLAGIQDEGKVSMECGHSIAMLRTHYRELVTKEQAAAWFAIMPSTPANVIQVAAPVAA